MTIRKMRNWLSVLWIDNYWSVCKRIWYGWCWRCGGAKGDEYDHLHGCSEDNGGVHLADQPWTRVRWAVAMVPLGLLMVARYVALLPIVLCLLVASLGLWGLGFAHPREGPFFLFKV